MGSFACSSVPFPAAGHVGKHLCLALLETCSPIGWALGNPGGNHLPGSFWQLRLFFPLHVCGAVVAFVYSVD